MVPPNSPEPTLVNSSLLVLDSSLAIQVSLELPKDTLSRAATLANLANRANLALIQVSLELPDSLVLILDSLVRLDSTLDSSLVILASLVPPDSLELILASLVRLDSTLDSSLVIQASLELLDSLGLMDSLELPVPLVNKVVFNNLTGLRPCTIRSHRRNWRAYSSGLLESIRIAQGLSLPLNSLVSFLAESLLAS
jgi:hypothetical protein